MQQTQCMWFQYFFEQLRITSATGLTSASLPATTKHSSPKWTKWYQRLTILASHITIIWNLFQQFKSTCSRMFPGLWAWSLLRTSRRSPRVVDSSKEGSLKRWDNKNHTIIQSDNQNHTITGGGLIQGGVFEKVRQSPWQNNHTIKIMWSQIILDGGLIQVGVFGKVGQSPWQTITQSHSCDHNHTIAITESHCHTIRIPLQVEMPFGEGMDAGKGEVEWIVARDKPK